MSRFVRLSSWVLTFASVGAVIAAWAVVVVEPPRLDANDAAEVAVDALDEADVEAEVAGPIEAVEHTPEAGDPIEAWAVPVEVDGEEIELRVQRSAGRLVFVDDRIGDGGTERLLDDEQFATIQDYRDDTLRNDAVIRNVGGTAAAALIALVGYRIAKRSGRIWR